MAGFRTWRHCKLQHFMVQNMHVTTVTTQLFKFLMWGLSGANEVGLNRYEYDAYDALIGLMV